MKTLVVIYNHNMPDLTDQLYESLKPYENGLYDTVIIDNGSKPEGKSKYTTFETESNCYFGGALNLALQFGQRGTSVNNFNESFIQFTLGYSLSDIWFNKRKYD